MDALPGRRVVCVTALHQVLLLRLEPAAAGALPVCVQVCRLPRVPPLVNCVLANLEPRIADPTVAAAQSQAQVRADLAATKAHGEHRGCSAYNL